MKSPEIDKHSKCQSRPTLLTLSPLIIECSNPLKMHIHLQINHLDKDEILKEAYLEVEGVKVMEHSLS